MAQVLKIIDDTLSVDFLTGNYKLAEDGFTTQTANEIVWDTLEIIGQTTDANIRTLQATLDKLKHNALEYHSNPVWDAAVWFYWQSEGESVKRSIVYDIQTEFRTFQNRGPLLGDSFITLRVAVKHSNIWENFSDAGLSGTGNISSFGGKATYTSINGTTDARIYLARVTSATTTDLTQFWIGILPDRNGVTNIVPVWEAENMTYDDITEVSTIVDATASGGNYARLDFSSQGDALQVRFGTVMSQHVGNTTYYVEHTGRWLVLMRCRVSLAGTKVRVRMRAGWGPASAASTVTSQILDGQTNWRLLEFGEIQIPPEGDRDGILSSVSVGFYQIVIDVERISGTGNFDFDALCLIPSEHIVTADTLSSEIDTTAGSSLDFFTLANDSQLAHVLATGSVAVYACNPSFKNWVFPRLGGAIVVAAQPAAGTDHNISATLNISNLTVFPRWWSFSNV